MWGEADAEGADLPVLPHAVEDDDAAGAAHRHEAREVVDQLVAVGEPARVEEVRAVEEIEGATSARRIPLPPVRGRRTE